MARKKILTRSGLQPFLSSTLRTVKLKELAEKRAKRLNILRKFIENIICKQSDNEDYKKSKISIEDFAAKIGLKPGTWSRLERFESCLSIEAAMWISVQVLQVFSVFVTAEWLLGESDNDSLPRIINKQKFDVYSYLKDIYQAEDLSKILNNSEKIVVREIFEELEVSKKLINFKIFCKIIKKFDNKFFRNNEKEIFDKLSKNEEEHNSLSDENYEVIKSICRRLIVSSDISDEEKSTRLFLLGFFLSDLFKKMNPNSMITYVRDNQMSPVFYKGEIVGGNLIPLTTLKSIDKQECIIELTNSIKIIRVIHYISSNTIITNTFSNENTPEIFHIEEIKSVALILFRYKNIEKQNLNIQLDNGSPSLISFDDIKA